VELQAYQHEAQLTDQFAGEQSERMADPRLVPLLGMGGEVGSLLTEYKKWVRDGDAHKLFPEQIEEELGDILWYLANAATRFGLDLDRIAVTNLEKTQDRWPTDGTKVPYRLYDEDFSSHEQLPRQFSAELREMQPAEGEPRVTVTIDGWPAGDPLADNAHDPDGYRFHDIFHLAHAAKLGWSPVLRGKLLKRPDETPPDRKRRSSPRYNEVEDGGRAIVIDEAVVAYVWEYARRHDFLVNVNTIDYAVLKTIKHLTGGLEVSSRSAHQWEEAILEGYNIWRQVKVAGGGIVQVDLAARSITCLT
jgi:NTP pyrophosphatase (non-canonical NTP hydrolase)